MSNQSQTSLTIPVIVTTRVGCDENDSRGNVAQSSVASPCTTPLSPQPSLTPTNSVMTPSPSTTGGRHSPVATSADGKFILQYLGAAMMDSRCSYTPQMMPWIIAEIMRFSEPLQVVLLVSNGQVTCNSMKTGKPIFDSHILDCIRAFPVITTESGDNGNNLYNGHYDVFDDRKYFATIIKANDIYLHCRLFSASSDEQVSEVMSTMKESTRVAVNGSVGPGVGGALRPVSSPKVSDLSDVPTDAITFEVLYTGKLRMSSRKAPASFIDDALAKFKSHENERGRRESVQISYSRRSSSQESTSDLGGSSDSLQSTKPTMTRQISERNEEDEDVFPCDVKTSSRSTLNYASMETIDKSNVGVSIKTPASEPITNNGANGDSTERQVSTSPPQTVLRHPLEDAESEQAQRTIHPSVESFLVKSMSLPVDQARNRTLSTGQYSKNNDLETNKSESQYNRTMILIIGRNELRIISPDAKTTLFSKHFREIYHSSQGMENKEYFGFICRESQHSPSGSNSGGGKASGTGYIAYVFRCESDSVAGDILKVLKQAYIVNHENAKKERQIQSCDHCPMVWYRQLCNNIDGMSCDEKIQSCILKSVNGLPEEDRQNILAKFHGAEPQTVQEQNELLMMLLRAHCESKQAKHIHDTAENRHEFLSQYLGGGAILMKAKRSISSSFDHLIKRKGSSGVVLGPSKEYSLPHYSTPVNREICGSPSERRTFGFDGPVTKSPGEHEKDNSEEGFVVSDSPLENIPRRPRSSTLGALSGDKIRCEIRNRRTSQVLASPLATGGRSPTFAKGNGNGESGLTLPSPRNMGSKEPKQHSPMMNIFLKVGSQNKTTPETTGKGVRRSGSWRHAIFKRVVSPSTPESGRGTPVSYPPSTPVSSRSGYYRPKRSRQEIRDLWKSAINQQIILIRMEKQNLRLKAKQQEADVKRLKLSYLELGTCDEEANDTWDLIMGEAQNNPTQKCDIQLLNSAILRGIPKHKRGQVWQFFIQQRKLGGDNPAFPNFSHINLDITYDQLLRQLTSQQHAILIDLGRTFPSHQYYSSPLGSGQLALFNILKAYSLLDTDVGYCQGLSFVAGLLLMHYEEEDAFNVLKYLMFTLGAREHYKPDMLGLQVKLYQLTRLIHDQDPDIQLLLYHNDVLPSLYAAPWFLTMFASQFPVGFAVRVVDLVLLHGVDVIAKFALAIVLDHKKKLMECNGLEQVMDCFKTVVTRITSDKLDRYLRKVMEAEWDKQMLTYAVEYSVMNDEAFSAFLSESSAPHLPIKANKLISHENKLVQTDDSRETSPTGTGESHPILGELIQRQNAEISKLKQDKAELRKDIQTLLSCVLTMQKLAKISSKGAICPPVPPQVTDIASKYVIGGANYFSSVMENGSDEEHRLSHHNRETLKAVDEYDERTVVTEETHGSPFYVSTREKTATVNQSRAVKNSSEFRIDDGSSSHGIPPLDQDSDDNSDHSSNQHHHHQMNSFEVLTTSTRTTSTRNGMNSEAGGENLAQNNNSLSGNKISTILM